MTSKTPDHQPYECPLCSLDFEGAGCHSSCPMSFGCVMVRCPRCGYEFVKDGALASLVRRFVGPRRKKDDSPTHR